LTHHQEKEIKDNLEAQEEKNANQESQEQNLAENQDNNANEAATEENAGSVTIESLQAQLEAQNAELEDYKNRYLRMQADFDNFRRRSTKDREDFVKFAVEGLVNSLLPVVDNFERALSTQEDQSGNFKSGVDMIFRQLKDQLTAAGLNAVEAVGCEFDPNCHEAVMQVASDQHEDNIVIEEFQRGYSLNGKVIRPAMVKVVKN
jgi:molecular chaperone GrpE